MANWLLAHQAQLQSYLLLGGFCVIAVWETLLPRRAFATPQGARWFNQVGLIALGALVVRLCVPLTAVALAAVAQQEGWGLFNRIALPSWLALLLGVVAIDLGGYVQHRLSHAVPWLWRFHRIHHSDLDVDCGTSIRHHPGEALFGQGFGLVVVIAVGISPLAALLGFTLGGVAAVFNHGNVALPRALDSALRWVIVTPDMHRIHHSTSFDESNRNFANLLPWWDYLFATYRRDPAIDHAGMPLGLASARAPGDVTLWKLLAAPFRPLPTEAVQSIRLARVEATAGP